MTFKENFPASKIINFKVGEYATISDAFRATFRGIVRVNEYYPNYKGI